METKWSSSIYSVWLQMKHLYLFRSTFNGAPQFVPTETKWNCSICSTPIYVVWGQIGSKWVWTWIRNLFEIHIKATKCEIFTIDILRHRQVEPKILLVLIPMVVRNRVFRNIQDTYQLNSKLNRCYIRTAMSPSVRRVVLDDTIRSALIRFRSRFRPDSPEKWKILRFF